MISKHPELFWFDKDPLYDATHKQSLSAICLSFTYFTRCVDGEGGKGVDSGREEGPKNSDRRALLPPEYGPERLLSSRVCVR